MNFTRWPTWLLRIVGIASGPVLGGAVGIMGGIIHGAMRGVCPVPWWVHTGAMIVGLIIAGEILRVLEARYPDLDGGFTLPSIRSKLGE